MYPTQGVFQHRLCLVIDPMGRLPDRVEKSKFKTFGQTVWIFRSISIDNYDNGFLDINF